MIDLTRCVTCEGRKRTLGMGGMEKPCVPCSGLGWISIKSEKEITLDGLTTPSGKSVEARKKRGPKPKYNNSELALEA